MPKRRSAILIAMFVALVACAPPSAPLFLRAPDRSSQDMGYVMFSITETDLSGSIIKFWPTLYLRGISNAVAEKVVIPITDGLVPDATGKDVKKSGSLGKLVLVELPPGDYKFVGYISTSIAATGTAVRHLSAPGFEYQFDVVSGEINYVGDLNFTPVNSLGTRFRTLGLGNPNAQPITGTGASSFNFFASPDLGMRFQVLDQQDRDAPLFDAEFPAYSKLSKIWCDGCALRNP